MSARKQQLVRGYVTPQRHQTITIHQIPKAERAQRSAESWWTSAPSTGFTAQAEALWADRYVKVAVRGAGAVERAIPESRRCEVCSRKFALNLRGPLRRFCSHACNQRAWKKRRKAA
jgi:streptogramin lyase